MMLKIYKVNLFMRCFFLFIIFFFAHSLYETGITFFGSLYLLSLIIFIIKGFYYKVRVDEKGLYLLQIIGANKQVKWDKIKQLEYKEVRAVPIYTIIDENGVTIRMTLIGKMGELLLIISKYAVNAEIDYRIKAKIEKFRKKYD